MALNTLLWRQDNAKAGECSDVSSPGAIQFKWLKETLDTLKKENVIVYLSGNTAPGPKYRKSCSNMYADFTALYADVIGAHLYGGSHTDEFSFLLKSNTTVGAAKVHDADFQDEVIGVINHAPAVDPTYNPGIRVYQYDVLNHALMTYTQYYLDMKSATKSRHLAFHKEYATREAYNMPDLSVLSWQGLVAKFEDPNRKLAEQLYATFKKVSVDGHPLEYRSPNTPPRPAGSYASQQQDSNGNTLQVDTDPLDQISKQAADAVMRQKKEKQTVDPLAGIVQDGLRHYRPRYAAVEELNNRV